MPRQIDTKYMTTGEITRLDGSPIPSDEPLMLFRGRDNIIVEMLDYYKDLRHKSGSSKARMALLDEQIQVIKTWQAQNPSKVRTPE